MACDSITIDKNTYESLQQELIELRQRVKSREYATDAIANSEKLLKDIAANVPGAIFQFTNRNGIWGVDYISDFIWELAGITAADMIQDFNSFFARVHPEDIEDYVASVVEAVENFTPWHYEGRLIKPDGEIVWWQGDSTPIRNNKGEIIFCGVLLDITDRKQVEAELKRLNEQLEARVEERTAALRCSEARLQRIADNVPGMLYEFRLMPDGTMSFPYASSRCRDIFELEPEHIKEDASLVFAHIHPEDVTKIKEQTFQSAQTLENFENEWRMITPSGQQKWIKTFSKPERQPEGEVIWYGCLFDISDVYDGLRLRQQVQQQLQAQAQFLQSIWEGVDYGIFVLDVLDDGGEFRYVKFNPAMLRNSPIPLESFVGKTMAESLPADMAHYYRQRYRECINLGKSIFYEEFFYAHDQETWWLLNVTPLLDSTARISQLVITGTDITERKQAEQELQRFVSLIEYSSDFIGFASLEGKPIFINEAGLKLIGVDNLAAVEDFRIIDCILPEDREYMGRCILPAVMECGLWQGEYRFRHFQTEEAIPVDFNMFLVKNSETGEPLCLATITRDISERKQAEAQLQEQEQFLRTIYDGVPHTYYL